MTKKQSSWIWFLLAVLPIIIVMSSIKIESMGANMHNYQLLNSMGFNADYDSDTANIVDGVTVEKYTIYFMEPKKGSMEEIIYNVIDKLMQSNSNYFIPQYIAYLIRLYIIKIAFDVFLLLPKICNRLINKAIGSSEVE